MDDDRPVVVMSPGALAGALTAAISLGAGLYGTFGSQVEAGSITKCLDQAKTAIRVSARNGDEITALRQLLYERTQFIHTREHAEDARRKQDRTDYTQDQRLNFLERQHRASE